MKRFKFCFECEYLSCNNVCELIDTPKMCPMVRFEADENVCKECEYKKYFFNVSNEMEMCCVLNFKLTDCPRGIKNPIPAEILKQFRND